MAYLDIECWAPEHVVSWMRGLSYSMDTISFDQIIAKKVNGRRLLLLNAQDFAELIPGLPVGGLQSIVDGLNLLRNQVYKTNTETLQSLTLELACQAKYLYNQLIQAEQSPRLLPVSASTVTPMTGGSKSRFDFTKVDSNMQINQSVKQRVSLESLDGVSIIVEQILKIVRWLNSTATAMDVPKFNKDFKTIVLRVAVELTSTAQRDQFVEQPNDVLKKTSRFLAEYCEWVVLAITDPEFIQPCWLDLVGVKKRPEEKNFGFTVQKALLSSLTIQEVIFSGPSHRSGRVLKGDEIVQINYQTVIGWTPERMEKCINLNRCDLVLTLKRKPSQSSLNPTVQMIKPYAIPLKRILSHNSESLKRQEAKLERDQSIDLEEEIQLEIADEDSLLDVPKEPKGPVYELQAKPRRELKRRVSISGSISDALVDLSLADALPIPTSVKAPPTPGGPVESTKPSRITKETLTKSVSHDTAKLYLHTLSIDRKHLWLPQSPKRE